MSVSVPHVPIVPSEPIVPYEPIYVHGFQVKFKKIDTIIDTIISKNVQDKRFKDTIFIEAKGSTLMQYGQNLL